jgi:dTDP-4-amino-4,6-dideoxygalactose transaminase
MTLYRIPFNRPTLAGSELDYLREALASGHHSGDGRFTYRCQELLERELGVAKVLLTTSGTHALEMAALLLEVGPGDEVLVPTFTFVSTANAFVLRGARPVFVDSRPDTLNLDERLLPERITPRTKAVVPVHYGGVGCAMDVLLTIAERHGLAVVEDNAHGLFGRYRDRWLGSIGPLAALSFHETKNFNCGEGGALLINDPKYVSRAEIVREKGTDRKRFFRGEVDKYTWVDQGSSYLPSDLLAAILWAQLERREAIQASRSLLWNNYREELGEWARERGVRLPVVPEDCAQPFHLFYLLLPTAEARAALISHLRKAGILAVFHYVPLHLSDMGRRFGGRPGDCPVAEDAADRLVRLPFFTSMTEAEQSAVIEAILAFTP